MLIVFQGLNQAFYSSFCYAVFCEPFAGGEKGGAL